MPPWQNDAVPLHWRRRRGRHGIETIAESARSATIRAKLNHPLIHADGHSVEFMLCMLDVPRYAGSDRVRLPRRGVLAVERPFGA
jgi:hypothetical protein